MFDIPCTVAELTGVGFWRIFTMGFTALVASKVNFHWVNDDKH